MKGKLEKKNKTPTDSEYLPPLLTRRRLQGQKLSDCLLMRTVAVLRAEFYELYWIENIWVEEAKTPTFSVFNQVSISNLDILLTTA